MDLGHPRHLIRDTRRSFARRVFAREPDLGNLRWRCRLRSPTAKATRERRGSDAKSPCRGKCHGEQTQATGPPDAGSVALSGVAGHKAQPDEAEVFDHVAGRMQLEPRVFRRPHEQHCRDRRERRRQQPAIVTGSRVARRRRNENAGHDRSSDQRRMREMVLGRR
jgi:hypothetical protein